jgi:hypothetical protein
MQKAALAKQRISLKIDSYNKELIRFCREDYPKMSPEQKSLHDQTMNAKIEYLNSRELENKSVKACEPEYVANENEKPKKGPQSDEPEIRDLWKKVSDLREKVGLDPDF